MGSIDDMTDITWDITFPHYYEFDNENIATEVIATGTNT